MNFKLENNIQTESIENELNRIKDSKDAKFEPNPKLLFEAFEYDYNSNNREDNRKATLGIFLGQQMGLSKFYQSMSTNKLPLDKLVQMAQEEYGSYDFRSDQITYIVEKIQQFQDSPGYKDSLLGLGLYQFELKEKSYNTLIDRSLRSLREETILTSISAVPAVLCSYLAIQSLVNFEITSLLIFPVGFATGLVSGAYSAISGHEVISDLSVIIKSQRGIRNVRKEKKLTAKKLSQISNTCPQ